MKTYADFLAGKEKTIAPAGFEPGDLPMCLKPHQTAITRWACRMGRCAIFADTGLGKTLMLLSWADQVYQQTGKPVLVLTPLAVAEQTIEESDRFGIGLACVFDSLAVTRCNVHVANYQKLHRIDPAAYGGVVLDESSILKAHDGKTRNALCAAFANTPYRLCCTATPAPNDHEELGNHCEFLGVMSRVEMLATYFVHDSADTSEWRLKGHAEGAFWRWVATWAVLCRRPSDLGFTDDGYDLPPLTVEDVLVETEAQSGHLFAVGERSLTDQRKSRKQTVSGRAAKAAELATAAGGSCVVWCERNDEQDAIEKLLGDRCVSIRGNTPDDERIRLHGLWKSGAVQTLVCKDSMFGHGMNWQHCRIQVFIGPSHSYERFYQCLRRSWRYGQTGAVRGFVVSTDRDGVIVASRQAKQASHEQMVEGMLMYTRDVNREQLGATVKKSDEYRTGHASGQNWELLLGDCVEQVAARPPESVDYSIFSPPFASLFTYSNSPRDMGNCGNYSEFGRHFAYLTAELFRVLKPGRLLSFHCMNLPTTKEHHGYIGIQDFRGDLIRAFQAVGFIYHSEVCIWKDPVVAMQRTKALGLLHKQLKKDSCMSRQGIADYVVTMRKPGKNSEPVSHTNESFPVAVWQRYASPVWTDINQGDVLQNYKEGRVDDDERHLCPLQLDVIRRCLELWSNPGDLVLSPFAGIGSEGHQAVKMGRRFLGCELKPTYFDVAVKNLKAIEAELRQPTLLDLLSDEEDTAA